MTYENIKSVILTFLVVTSIVLTWNLWTYQPKYATMEHSNTVQEVVLSQQKEIGDIIKPDKVIYHFKDAHFGTTNSNDVNRILEVMSGWNFYEIDNISGEVARLSEFVHAKGNVEIIFPAAVPMDLYKNVIQIEDKKVPNFKFNRIVIDVENRTKDDGHIYFVNYGNSRSHQVYASHIKAADIKKFYNEFYSVSNQLNPYFPFEVSEGRTIFLPQNKTVMKNYKYFLTRLDPEQVKDALFNDPSYVQRNDDAGSVEYTNGSSMLTVDNNSLMLFYVNPAEEIDGLVNTKDLLKKSVNFINAHGGWTGLYKYASIDEENNKITYRLYDRNGSPIFNEQGLAEIVQVWGKNEVYKYSRSSFSSDVPLTIETNEVALNSGNEVLEYLKKKKGFKQELLLDLVIGYKMSKDPDEPQLMNLEPSWFYNYGNAWVQINDKDLGGGNRGLE